MADSVRTRTSSLLLFVAATVVVGAALAAALQGLLAGNGGSAPWVALLLGGGLALVGWLRVRRFIERSVAQVETMTRNAAEIARGDLERSIPVEELDLLELRDLAAAINAMAARARSDIAEMKRLERVRSEFLGNVSHELRTPIFSVQGYLETLIDGAVDDPAVRDDFLQKAHQNALRLRTLLTDLIEISRIESGEMKMSFRYFDLRDYLETLVAELHPTAQMASVTLEIDLPHEESEIAVLGDRDRLKQVFVNLIENAIKYNHPGGTVTLRVLPQAEEVEVHVVDTGIGIPEEDIGRIFERFYRVDRDRGRSVGGSGLGLAIVKHIVEKHGSPISVRSRMGEGSDFSFVLKRSNG